MPEASNESRSSVEVSLTAKGEAQIKVKSYEGEEAVEKAEDGDAPITHTMPGAALVSTTVNRLWHAIEELEEKGIKVVGRDAPVSKDIESTIVLDQGTDIDLYIGKNAGHAG